MTTRQRRFIEEYCVDFNATQAAIRAGYSERTAYSIGHENLRKPEIREAVDERLSELAMTTEEALKRLSDIAFGDISAAFEIRTVGEEEEAQEVAVVSIPKLLKSGQSRLIKSITYTRNGPRVEMHDPQAAIDKILRVRGAYRDHLTVETDQVIGLEIIVPQDSDEDSE